ncbi:MAG TPA: CDP-alcohol phosphatidyltransferase family protein [Candidatus Limnocylindrales bacterium]|nr:CDP-alcohol phosphatidyltransferase family protein [Candidatus Limnocylindrales bacterium]
MSGSFVSPELRQRVRGAATPIAAGFGRLGLTPNHLTLIGFGVAVVGAVAAAQGAWLAAGILLIVGGVFDLFDGALARATGQASRLGAFMDSVFDRAGEGVVYVGIAAGCVAAGFGAGAVLSAGAMTAAFMVSYVRAKSESLGFTAGSRMAAVGLAPREVRLVILTVGLLVTGIAGGVRVIDDPTLLVSYDAWGSGRWALAAALGLITILATITTIQRIVHVIGQPSSKEHE